MFKLKSKGIVDSINGLISKPIPYEVRVPNGDWSPYFGKYQNQKWGLWDSNSCWCLSAVNCAEDQLEYLYKTNQLSKEAIQFFTVNGYLDSDGDFSISERFLEILSGAHDNGNSQMLAWTLMEEYGILPRAMLTYTKEKAQMFTTKGAFNADYFNVNAVTPQMLALAKESKKYIKIASQFIGRAWTTPNILVLRAALKQAPLQIGVPVPRIVSDWNNSYIQYDGKKAIDHAIEMYAINDNEQRLIFDQYQPNLKVLSKDYPLVVVTQGIVTPVNVSVNPIPQDLNSNTFWGHVMDWWNGFFNSDVGDVNT